MSINAAIWKAAAFALVLAGPGTVASARNEPSTAPQAATDCAPSGGLNFICGVKNPEDLVALPGGRWIVASGMAPASGLHLVDARKKTATRWIAPRSPGPMALYANCPSQPAADEIQAHGISVRPRGNGHAILYVVNHGGKTQITDLANGVGRETIEVFDINMTRGTPTIAWQGCVPLPDKLVANGVTSGPDGAIYATVMTMPGTTPADLWISKPTGAVYKWRPGTPGFSRIAGTELTGNNGIELSRDGRTLYVVDMRGVTSFTNTQPAVRLKTGPIVDGLGDNIRWAGNRLVVGASRLENCPSTGPGFGCMTGYHVSTVDPRTLAVTRISTGENTAAFSGVSVALPVGRTLWLGSYSADRIAYRALP